MNREEIEKKLIEKFNKEKYAYCAGGLVVGAILGQVLLWTVLIGGVFWLILAMVDNK